MLHNRDRFVKQMSKRERLVVLPNKSEPRIFLWMPFERKLQSSTPCVQHPAVSLKLIIIRLPVGRKTRIQGSWSFGY